MRLAVLAVLAGCNPLFGIPGGSQLTPEDAPSGDDAPIDAPRPTCQQNPGDCVFTAVDRPIAGPGDTIVLEGFFGDSATVTFPSGITMPVAMLGPNRGTAVVPDGSGPGVLSVTTAGRQIGSVPFFVATFPIDVRHFQSTFDQSNGARQTPRLGVARQGAAAFTANGFAYVSGGTNAGAALADVEHARINADGTLGPFVSLGSVLGTGRAEHCAVVLQDKLYLIGGLTGAFATMVNQGFPLNSDGTLGTAFSVQGLAHPRRRAACVVIGPYLYVIGGADDIGTSPVPTRTIERARIAADGTLGVFETVPILLGEAREGATATVLKNRLYIIGGTTGTGLPAASEQALIEGDGSLGQFFIGPSLGVPRQNHVVFVTAADLFVIGGRAATGAAFSIERATIAGDGTLGAFSPSAGRLVAARDSAAATTIGTFFYLFGGAAGSGNLDTLERATLDGGPGFPSFTTNIDVTVFEPTDVLAAFSGAVVRDSVYVFGGQKGATPFNTIRRAAISADGTLATFGDGGTFATARGRHASAVVGDFVYLLGGSNGVSFLDSVERLPIDATGALGTSVASGVLPSQRDFFSALVIGNKLCVIGGNVGAGSQLANVDCAPINSDGTIGTFAASGSTLGHARDLHASVVIGNRIYVIGGTGNADAPLDNIESAQINANGTIGAFTDAGTLTAVHGSCTAAVVGRFLYVIGNSNATVIERAPIDLDGSLGTFSVVTGVTLDRARSGQLSIQLGNRLFAIAGADAAATNDVGETLLR